MRYALSNFFFHLLVGFESNWLQPLYTHECRWPSYISFNYLRLIPGFKYIPIRHDHIQIWSSKKDWSIFLQKLQCTCCSLEIHEQLHWWLGLCTRTAWANMFILEIYQTKENHRSCCPHPTLFFHMEYETSMNSQPLLSSIGDWLPNYVGFYWLRL